MDVALAVSGYVAKMVAAGDAPSGMPSAKMKILLLDGETVRAHLRALLRVPLTCFQVSVMSTATTQSSLLNHEVFLIEYVCSRLEKA